MNVLSLFDGISCGQLALNRAGIKYNNYFASEINNSAIQITQHHFPNTIQLGDVQTIDYSKLPKIDLLIGGSPCQSFSFAGNCLSFDDPRGQLFFKYVEALKIIKPNYFLFENVLMKIENRNKISKLLGVDPLQINSSLFSAQDRKRLYWTNINTDTNIKDKNIYVKDILESNVDISFNLNQKLINKYNIDQFKNIKCKVLYVPFINFENSKIRETNKSFTIVASADKRHIIVDKEGNIRRFTLLECERLQTLPDNYTNINNFSKSRRYELIGNCWTVDVIVHILKGIN